MVSTVLAGKRLHTSAETSATTVNVYQVMVSWHLRGTACHINSYGRRKLIVVQLCSCTARARGCAGGDKQTGRHQVGAHAALAARRELLLLVN